MKKLMLFACLSLAVLSGPVFAEVLDFRTEGLGGQGTVLAGDEWLDIGVELSTPDTRIEVGCAGGSSACVGASETPNDFEGRMVIRFVSPGTTTQSSSLNVNVDFCCESNSGSTDSVLYDVNGQVITSFTDTDISYQGGTPVGWIEVDFGFDAIFVIEFDSEAIEPSATATFAVSKDFSDNNPAPVDVSLVCNAGLPLVQTFTISDDAANAPAFGQVTFTVRDFADGTMDCTVSEASSTTGYTKSYTAGGDSTSGIDDSGCHFSAVNLGDANTCVINNTLEAVGFTINKEWSLPDGMEIPDTTLGIELTCENFRSSPDSDLQSITVSEDVDASDFPIPLILWPNHGTPATRCRLVETQLISGMESDQGCAEWITLLPGSEAQTCTITNTMFFEGIPVLDRFGLAVLILLVSGAGLIGFRRFA